MTSPAANGHSRLLFDWTHDGGPRLALWIVVAIALHAGAYTLFRVSYPPPEAARISDATLYVLPPSSAEAARLAPFLASADPALFAPERSDRLTMLPPEIPAYEPSYAAATPELAPLPDPDVRVLPPLLRDFGPVPVAESRPSVAALPAPASDTQIQFSSSLRARAPTERPKTKFTARPGDLLAPTTFLLAVAPDGRVLHVLREEAGEIKPIDDAASRLLMRLWFQRRSDSQITWGTATFHWGLDVKREELR